MFDAAKFIAKLEGLGASLTAVQLQDGSAHISRKFKPGAYKAQIEALWREQVEPFPERQRAIGIILVKRSRHGAGL